MWAFQQMEAYLDTRQNQCRLRGPLSTPITHGRLADLGKAARSPKGRLASDKLAMGRRGGEAVASGPGFTDGVLCCLLHGFKRHQRSKTEPKAGWPGSPSLSCHYKTSSRGRKAPSLHGYKLCRSHHGQYVLIPQQCHGLYLPGLRIGRL